jgi:hypothetical protein
VAGWKVADKWIAIEHVRTLLLGHTHTLGVKSVYEVMPAQHQQLDWWSSV